MKIGIVGSEAAKFTPETERRARLKIWEIIQDADVVISGACHLGGIDIWAVEEAFVLEIPTVEYPPAKFQWSGGYKERNIKIAQNSDLVVCITVEKLPPDYMGMRFNGCYHCHTPLGHHVKSGGCWTIKYAAKIGKQIRLEIIQV